MEGKEVLAKISELEAELQQIQAEGKPVVLFLATKLLEELESQGYKLATANVAGMVTIWEHKYDTRETLEVDVGRERITGVRYEQ
jgi:hypothetical protein